MEIQIERKGTRNIYRTSILQQTGFWSEVKRRQGVSPKAFDIKVKASDIYAPLGEHDYIVDDLLILFQPVGDDHQIAYVPYGPTIKPSEEKQGIFLEEVSESLRPHLPPKCILLRYDLVWESLWARDDSYFDDGGHWTGPPGKVNQEIRLNFETQNWNLKKANTNILPSDTVFLDLRKDEDRLLKKMKPKTRYNVRLALRKGVHVRRAGLNDLDIWYELYRETCARNGIYTEDKEYFKPVLNTTLDDASSTAKVEMLIAEIDNRALAAMFLGFSNKRATYLYGASSSKNRKHMATYALQWEAIRRAKERGCTEYDMFGVSPYPDPSHPLYGLYRFKIGFGGKLFHRMGCWDYPLHSSNYDTYLTAEMQSQGYHLYSGNGSSLNT